MSSPIPPTDLTRRPPRSMRQRLGGFVLLPRILDKGRAKLAKKNGDYNYDSPTDQHLVRFLGLDLEALLKELAKGKADGEILEWEGECQDPVRAVRNRGLVGLYGKARTEYDAETLSGFADYVGHPSKTGEDI